MAYSLVVRVCNTLHNDDSMQNMYEMMYIIVYGILGIAYVMQYIIV